MTTDAEGPGVDLIYGPRLGRVPRGLDVLDEAAEPRPLRCHCCHQLAWFPTRALRDLVAQRNQDPRVSWMMICLTCALDQLEDPGISEGWRSSHLEVFRTCLDLVRGQTEANT